MAKNKKKKTNKVWKTKATKPVHKKGFKPKAIDPVKDDAAIAKMTSDIMTVAACSWPAAFGADSKLYHYSADVIKVVDGDTLHVSVDLGMDIHTNCTLRLNRINAPETNSEEGQLAKVFLTELLRNRRIGIKTIKDRKEKYGRYLAEVFIIIDAGIVNVNDLMVAEKHAVHYDGGARS